MTPQWQGPEPSTDTLARCVGDVEAFVGRCWGRRPWLHRGDADDVSDLLSIDDVDRILTGTSPRRPAIRVLRDGREVPAARYTRVGTVGSRTVGDLADVDHLLALFDDGATIVLQGLQRTWPPVGRLCRGIEAFLSHPVQANAYLTPPGSRGLRVHHDTHDVFALHTHGRKRWVTYPPVMASPLPGQHGRIDPTSLGPPDLDTELVAGDCLYMPRGTPHAAATTGEASLHLTLGVRVVTWHDVARRLVDRAREVPAFREALPIGFGRRPDVLRDEVPPRLAQLTDLLLEADPDGVARDEADRVRRRMAPRPQGSLVSRLVDLDEDTVLRPPDGLPATVEVARDRLRLRRGGTTLEMPAWVEPAVRALVSGPVRLGYLPGGMDVASRRVLARRLIHEGVVVVQRPAT